MHTNEQFNCDPSEQRLYTAERDYVSKMGGKVVDKYPADTSLAEHVHSINEVTEWLENGIGSIQRNTWDPAMLVSPDVIDVEFDVNAHFAEKVISFLMVCA